MAERARNRRHRAGRVHISGNFDQNLRAAFRREIELFVDSVIREDRSVLDLLTADYTFVNERLALHYGIPDIRGDQFRRVTLDGSESLGLARQGQRADGHFLPQPHRARDARRVDSGEHHWARRRRRRRRTSRAFKENKEGEKAKTVREIMEQHRSKPSCNACHGVMDPLGFALENFDAIGAWRTKDRGRGNVRSMRRASWWMEHR